MTTETYKELLAWAVFVGWPMLVILFFASIFIAWIILIQK